MTSADILTAYETCDRKGFWSQTWQRRRLDSTAFLREAIRAGVLETERADFGEVAGEAVMELGADPGMEMPSSRNLHQSVVHHAALADALTTAVRRAGSPAWGLVPPGEVNGQPWASSAFLDPSGNSLRRVVLASTWNDVRHYAELRSWYSLGEVAVYGLPLSLIVLTLGQNRDGRRSGPWTRGFLHPKNHKLRFRKKSKTTFETFSDSWEHVWREDRGDISTRDWLQAMVEDDVLRDVCFRVELEVPAKPERDRILRMAAAKLERLAGTKTLPEASMSVCERPACAFKACCWSQKETTPSEAGGFVKL